MTDLDLRIWDLTQDKAQETIKCYPQPEQTKEKEVLHRFWCQREAINRVNKEANIHPIRTSKLSTEIKLRQIAQDPNPLSTEEATITTTRTKEILGIDGLIAHIDIQEAAGRTREENQFKTV